MSDTPFEHSTHDSRFERIIAEILQAEEQGQTPQLDRYLESFPDLAGPLRDYLRDREAFNRLAPHLAAAQDRRTDVAPLPQSAGPDVPTQLDLPGAHANKGFDLPAIPGYEVLGELGRG
ncbi:MAG TPA: hypothetical protein VKD72_39930, partial [Gemmataceae bacterium]|nr:hypothetical protein [Gemmataceae bacterium]